MERRPVIIVGSGPAGVASALFLHAADPMLAQECLLLEKAHHPRPKVCAGGLIPHTLRCLRELDVPLSVPNVVVHRARVEVPGRCVEYSDRELCRVVRRDEFDHSLVRACRERGIEVREGEKVRELRRDGNGVRITTDTAEYYAAAVIGADGSGSAVRRQLFAAGREHVGRAVMCDIPVTQTTWRGYAEERYDFIFRAVPRGLRGYAWAFPCVIGGAPHVNVGVYSVAAEGNGRLLATLLRDEVVRMGTTVTAVKAFPIRWSAADAPIAVPRVMLAGDAAGVDPLMGEGISYSFEYGRRAAAAVRRAVTTGDFSFADYQESVAGSWLGRKLRRLALGVRLFYGPTWWLWFAFAGRSRQAQEIGIRWYNGVDEWDQRSGWEAVGAWWRSVYRSGPGDAPARQ